MNYRNYVVFKTTPDPRYNQAKLFMPKNIVNRYVRLHAPTNDDMLATSGMTTRGTTISDQQTRTALQKFLEHKEQEALKRNINGSSATSNAFI